MKKAGMKADILIVDDEQDIRALIGGILGDEGYATRQACDSDQALAALSVRVPDVIILDIWLQNSARDGLEILAHVRETHPHIPVLMISGHGTIETAVSAMKQGAYDFIEKPFKADRLLLLIERALETARLRRENTALKKKEKKADDLHGVSPAIHALRQVLERVAGTHSRILLTGEQGTGKDVAARMIHRLSPRAAGPLMILNCATLHPERLEQELFGTQFPQENAPPLTGILEQAHGGTLVLDEVADMPLETQGKIVRVLQEQRFHRVGGGMPIEVDVRVIATTNRDLGAAMTGGMFRQDLYYRLSVVPVRIPPLREHVEDIPVLAAFFMTQFSQDAGIPCRTFSPAALAAMQIYGWPGNVRQLRNAIEWAMIMAPPNATVLGAEHLPPDISAPPEGTNAPRGDDFLALPLREAREAFEKDYLLAQIDRFRGSIVRTARFVGMERSALHRKLKSLDITPHTKDSEAEDVARTPEDSLARTA